jgi:hypothetical protein
MINARDVPGDDSREYQCLECEWWWPVSKYSVGYLMSEMLEGSEEEDGAFLWACNFCMLQTAQQHNLLQILNSLTASDEFDK